MDKEKLFGLKDDTCEDTAQATAPPMTTSPAEMAKAKTATEPAILDIMKWWEEPLMSLPKPVPPVYPTQPIKAIPHYNNNCTTFQCTLTDVEIAQLGQYVKNAVADKLVSAAVYQLMPIVVKDLGENKTFMEHVRFLVLQHINQLLGNPTTILKQGWDPGPMKAYKPEKY